MLCPNVLVCGTVGHYVCEAMGVSATVCADFVDEVIYSLLVSYQSKQCDVRNETCEGVLCPHVVSLRTRACSE